ncbi:hypothetical protein ABT297_04135 [Dactylosporangium sp. NPDC000555]|uniref:hypothetical protein n=1 Tax=Dactylosporangium sp. NPDC000555 TaxID=3154260 RepID=UPI00331DB027
MSARASSSTFEHLGDRLTAAEIQALPDGAEIMVTWSGGNGPWPYRVLVDRWGGRNVETIYCDPLTMTLAGERYAHHHVTAGWSDVARTWHDAKPPVAEHIVEKWRKERGQPAGPVLAYIYRAPDGAQYTLDPQDVTIVRADGGNT